jgi:hypothetical protein
VNKKNFKVEHNGPAVKIALFENVDEDFQFKDLQIDGATHIDLFLGGVKAINSCGIREWVRWISEIGSAVSITFHECSKPIVDQINMVKGFLPTHCRVESFMVPYYSESTEESKLILFRNGVEFGSKKVNPPANIVDSSGNQMDLDVVEKRYFNFILAA